MTNKYEQKKSSEIPEEEKRKLRKKTNSFISRYCGFAALVIILITFAAFILGEADGFYSQCGIMASIALWQFRLSMILIETIQIKSTLPIWSN